MMSNLRTTIGMSGMALVTTILLVAHIIQSGLVVMGAGTLPA